MHRQAASTSAPWEVCPTEQGGLRGRESVGVPQWGAGETTGAQDLGMLEPGGLEDRFEVQPYRRRVGIVRASLERPDSRESSRRRVWLGAGRSYDRAISVNWRRAVGGWMAGGRRTEGRFR